MTIDYTWTIYNMTVIPQVDIESNHYTNVVTQLWWILRAQEGSHVTDTNGIVDLPTPSMPFSDFEQLTQEQVLGWLHQILGEETIASLKTSLAGRIQSMINPPVVHKLPSSWNPAPPASEEQDQEVQE